MTIHSMHLCSSAAVKKFQLMLKTWLEMFISFSLIAPNGQTPKNLGNFMNYLAITLMSVGALFEVKEKRHKKMLKMLAIVGNVINKTLEH